MKGDILRHTPQPSAHAYFTGNKALTWMISGARYSGVPHRVQVLVHKNGKNENSSSVAWST